MRQTICQTPIRSCSVPYVPVAFHTFLHTYSWFTIKQTKSLYIVEESFAKCGTVLVVKWSSWPLPSSHTNRDPMTSLRSSMTDVGKDCHWLVFMLLLLLYIFIYFFFLFLLSFFSFFSSSSSFSIVTHTIIVGRSSLSFLLFMLHVYYNLSIFCHYWRWEWMAYLR